MSSMEGVTDRPVFTDFAGVTPQTPLGSLNLDWHERDLPERERTKHVHRLHPYLGKFVPQLAEIFLRKFRPRLVCDPFVGSGTTLVEATALGIPAFGCDISEFNCLLARVKTARYKVAALRREVDDILTRVSLLEAGGLFSDPSEDVTEDNNYLQSWFRTKALAQLLRYRGLMANYEHQDVMRVILSRSARSARMAKHFELDWPKEPQTEPYHCFKHRRICRPTEEALQFLGRYSRDTLQRLAEFEGIRTDVAPMVVARDAREVEFPSGIDLVLTSPPYVGIIDYHEQHRYAYELLGLPWRAQAEIGPAASGSGQAARRCYVGQMEAVLARLRPSLAQGATVVIVVNDRHNLYEAIGQRLGFTQLDRLERQVNRRTGMRGKLFHESILVWQS